MRALLVVEGRSVAEEKGSKLIYFALSKAKNRRCGAGLLDENGIDRYGAETQNCFRKGKMEITLLLFFEGIKK